MNRKLNCIVLVDDDDDANFFHERLIKKLDIAERVVTCADGKETIDFLMSDQEDNFIPPSMILLDINMPIMDGWQFLEAYEALDESRKAKIVIVMLTTSLNPVDKKRADDNEHVVSYVNKYLNEAKLMDIVNQYFD